MRCLTAAAILLFTAGTSSALAAPPPFRVTVVGQGPAMILIPGLNTSGAVWNTIVGELKDRYTCHVLTLAGFAGEPAIEPPFLSTMRDALLHYIESQQLDRPVLVGHCGFRKF